LKESRRACAACYKKHNFTIQNQDVVSQEESSDEECIMALLYLHFYLFFDGMLKLLSNTPNLNLSARNSFLESVIWNDWNHKYTLTSRAYQGNDSYLLVKKGPNRKSHKVGH
jgi:hypothetical protein